ncbi:MAG: hypothetical protein AAF694_11255 [Bacteroidota bacterium]
MKQIFGSLNHLLVCLIVFLSFSEVYADKILANMDFRKGNWSVVGIPIHNFQMLPVQSQLGTFVSEDKGLMKSIQSKWDLKMTFRDKCDYHYELKFYLDGSLKRTLKVNLVCGTLYDDGISYKFSPQMFEEVRKAAKPVDWSRITFGNLELLRKAISVLDNTPGILWYKDVQPYRYSGFFMIRVVGIPWKENMDVVYENVKRMVADRVRSNDFHLQQFLTTVSEGKRTVKYYVYCEEPIADLYGKGQYIRWRSHFFGEDSVQIVAIGVDIRKYMQLMRKEKGVRTRNNK